MSMRNGLLGALTLLCLFAAPAHAQTPSPAALNLEAPWQPSAAEPDDRPNVGPRGYPIYGTADYLLWWTEKDRPVTADFGALLRNGERTVLGYWLNQQQTCGLEIGGFWMLDRFPSEGDSRDISRLWGGEAQLRQQIFGGTWGHVDLLGGARFLSLDEALGSTELAIGTHNRFYGGQLGAEGEWHRGKFSVDLWGKAALGVDDETIHVAAERLNRDAFAVVPEAGCDVGYQLTNNIRLRVGYTFFYLSDAARPGDQVPLAPARGAFWGQGLNVGLEFRF
jgi:hypothetical protein